MKKTQLTTQHSLSLKEKRLVFLADDNPSVEPSTSTPDSGKEKQEAINKLLVGEAKKSDLDKTTIDWAQADAETDSLIGKAKGWIDSAEQSDDFKKDVSSGLKSLKKKYDKIKWAEITDEEFNAFKASVESKLSGLEAKAAIDASIKTKKEQFTGENLTTGIETWANTDPVVGTLEEPMKTSVLSAVKAHMAGAEKDILDKLTELESQLNSPDAEIGTIETEVAGLPDDIIILLNAPTGYPSTNQKVAEIKAYFIGVGMMQDRNKLFPFIEGMGDDKLKVPKDVLAALEAKFKGYLDDPSKMPNPSDLLTQIKEAQTKVLLHQVIGSLDATKTEELKKLIGGKEVTPENLTNFLEKYKSFVYDSENPNRQKVLEILVAEIDRQGLNVDVVVEGGADAQAVSLKKSNETKYKDG